VTALDAVSFTLLQDDLRGVLATLSEREASIVQLRFGLTDGQLRTFEQIGHVHGTDPRTDPTNRNSDNGQAAPPLMFPGAARLPALRPQRGNQHPGRQSKTARRQSRQGCHPARGYRTRR
jgi:Sigma-70, region 4